MADIEIVEQRPLSLIEVKESLSLHKEKFKELNFRSQKVEGYVQDFAAVDKDKAIELEKKLSEAVQKLKERHIKKIIDVMPADLNQVKTIFTGEAINLKQEELKQIVDIVNG
ncbi:hypothetical protein J4476_05380 [Candidatus Woesearchaeota archaeon]|nr:MAG: hypothetical protein QT09_C0017G0011 [archaeon GW2011_AR18]MBS3162097.1 hypothetical protein [Candidatus Woesearchaeota archaeon]